MTYRPRHGPPLGRTEGLLVEEVGSETVVYDTDSREAHCLSPLAAAVYAHCDGRTATERLSELASTRLGEPVSPEQVDAALAQLEECGLLVAPPSGISRRQLVRRTAVATAAVSAAPMITSIVTPAHAQSPRLNCQNSQCASGQAGDAWCACVNTCPPSHRGHSRIPRAARPSTAQPAPFYGSCECLRCPRALGPNDNGQYQSNVDTQFPDGLLLGFFRCQALYGANYWKTNPAGPDNAANWKDWSQPCTTAHVNNNFQFGCLCRNRHPAPRRRIDGGCYNEPGNTSQPGLGLICE